jgi:hypothetical protein
LDPEGGITIEPERGFVIKTFDNHKEKIFINVVQHEIIDMPEEKMLVDYEVIFTIYARTNQDSGFR